MTFSKLLTSHSLLGLLAVVHLSCNVIVAQQIDFSSQVRPILSDRCFHCHGPDADNQESDFRADSKEGLLDAVEPGDLDASELHLRIHSDDPDTLMPPPDSNRKLSKEEKRILDLWIEQGATYEGHWAFEAPIRPNVPSINQLAKNANNPWIPDQIEKWSINPIDAFVGRKLIERGLVPSVEASNEKQIRRAALTLTGLLPERSLQDISYVDAVDHLLGSMAYAERQTLRWLDAARYADTDGYQNDHARENWPWRDWVIQAYHNNMPFDQFTIEQIAGDMLPNATRNQILASAFNRNHRQNGEGGALADEFRVENVIDRVETTSTVFLGLTFGCARCHDHKYDPLSQREFFQMYGYFNNIGEKGIGKGVDANPTLKVFSPFVNVDESLLEDLKRAETELANDTKPSNDRFETWKEEKNAVVERVDQLEKAEKSAAVSKADRTQFDELEKAGLVRLFRLETLNPGQKRSLRQRFEQTDPTQKKLKGNLNAALKKLRETGAVRATVMVMRERDGEPVPSYILDRGQYDSPIKDEELPRSVPEILLSADKSAPKDRLEFARWLVSRDNPLTARVIVNRVWQDHFGVGLVKTSEDFGVQGETPSHPELLDWLAVEFIESGWDVKALHRLIVSSATFRQSSKHTVNLQSIDPENRLLARGPRYRADGFTIRDIALQAAGLLNREPGGPSVKPYQPDGLWESLAANKGTKYTPSSGDQLFRKSMYSFWKRAVNPPRQIIFDAGGREVCNVQVRRTNTPLQALVLMNDPTFIESAKGLAATVLKKGHADDKSKLRDLYQSAVAVPLNDKKLSLLADSLVFFRDHFSADRDAASKLLGGDATKSGDLPNESEFAAFTAVAHVILNLDEFVTIE